MNSPLHQNAIGPRGEPPSGRYHALAAGAVLSLVLGALSAVIFVAESDWPPSCC